MKRTEARIAQNSESQNFLIYNESCLKDVRAKFLTFDSKEVRSTRRARLTMMMSLPVIILIITPCRLLLVYRNQAKLHRLRNCVINNSNNNKRRILCDTVAIYDRLIE